MTANWRRQPQRQGRRRVALERISNMPASGFLLGMRTVLAMVALWIVFLWTSLGHAQLLSPGDLAKVHAKWSSDAECTRCHEGGRGVVVGLCTDCHSDIGGQLSRKRGLHGTKFREESRDCGHCHVEHRGRTYELIRWPGGSQQGFEGEHKVTGFPLTGGHAELKCQECHTQRNSRGARTFLEPEKTCVGCHRKDDKHDGRLGTRCQDCHDDRRWKGAKTDELDHDKTRFPLKGKHQKVDCNKCHTGEPPQYFDMDFKTCGSCHEDPHRGSRGKKCSTCHVETGWKKIQMSRAAHPGLRIDGGHRKVKCKQCHDQGLMRPPRKGSRCVTCHAPVHEARFGNDCKRCHGDITWLGLPDKLGRKVHHLTDFPLVGMHQPVACKRCHLPRLPRAQRYRGLAFERCSDCHEDAHGGKLSRYQDGDCVGCHDPHGFRPTLFTIEDHVQAAFPLVGLHVAVACHKCHQIDPPRLDWSIAHQRCEDCHENPHGNQFEKEMAEGGCATCHRPVGWRVPNIDHSTWPLTGAHELVACAACHNPTETDRKRGGGASYRGVPRDCEGCHNDVHAGQFRLSEPVRPCTDCHTTVQFAIERFDHEPQTGYRLDGKHAELECEGCHRTETLASGLEAVRYRLGYNACSDCHADPHRVPQAGVGP